jgi:hypothetical protein
VHDVTFYDDKYFRLDKSLSKKYPWNLLVTPHKKLTYICVSQFLKDNLLETFKKAKHIPEIVVIPNVHDIPKFLQLTPIMRSFYDYMNGAESDLIACIPVRAVPRKKLEVAIEITRVMVKKGINFKLLLTANVDYKRVENTQYYTMLKGLIVKYKLENHVYFLEEFFQKYNVKGKPAQRIPIPEVYLISDFLLMTSVIEGFGLPIIEAGVLRCPIFANDIPPFREIGSTNINYFSIKDKPEKIANFILKHITEQPQSYFYRKVIQQYSMKKTFKTTILPFIEKLVKS